MDTLKHGKVYNTLPRILQQISDENRALYRTGDIQSMLFLMQNIRKCKNIHRFLHFFLSFPESCNEKCVYQVFKSQAKANHYFGENLIARGVNQFFKTVKYKLQLLYVVKRCGSLGGIFVSFLVVLQTQKLCSWTCSINNHLTPATGNAAGAIALVTHHFHNEAFQVH